MKETNLDYVRKNFEYGGNVVDWLWQIKAFFGEEQAEKFCEHFINAHNILDKNDMRNLVSRISLSVFSMSKQEQLAFLTAYQPIKLDGVIAKNMKNGFEKAQKMYRKRNRELSKKIKNLGYSYSLTLGNWKDNKEKDTYQREYIFVIYSETDTEQEFKNNMLKLAEEYKIESIFITETLKSNNPRLEIDGKIYLVETGEMIQSINNIKIPDLEKYFSELYKTKFLFKVPYERNKKILFLEEEKIGEYYSKEKQEKVRKSLVHSFNMGILKQSLINAFSKENYNQ